MKMPLFPLSSHILPKGRMRLRIFEARYIRMVKQACSNQSGFVMCMVNSKGSASNNSHIYPIGTVCKIIDFDVLDDGLLGLTIEATDCVSISEIETEQDELRIGICKTLENARSTLTISEIKPLDERLKEVFTRFPDVSSLYSTLSFDDPAWVINRWIEILPIEAEQKQLLLSQYTDKEVLTYVSQLIG